MKTKQLQETIKTMKAAAKIQNQKDSQKSQIAHPREISEMRFSDFRETLGSCWQGGRSGLK